MSLFFNMLSRLVISFIPRSKRLLISWLQSPSAVILEPKKIVCHCFHCFPIYLFSVVSPLKWIKCPLVTRVTSIKIFWTKMTACLKHIHNNNIEKKKPNKYILPLTVWLTINCGKFWKRWEYQTTWPASWEICMQGQEATVRTRHGTTDWFQIGKGVHQTVYCHSAYLTYIQSTSWEIWASGSINWNQDCQEKYQ